MKSKSITAAAVLLSATQLAHAGLKEDIAAREAAIAQLQSRLTPVITPLLVTSSDLRVFLSLTPVVDAVTGFNDLPPASRLVELRATGRNGNFWDNGGTWCGSYVELAEGNSLRGSGQLSRFAANIQDNGGILISTRASLNGSAQLKFQFKGRRVHGPFGVGNYCPPVSVGTSIGVSFDKEQDLALLVSFARSADGRSLGYNAALTHPNEIKLTAQVGLGPIGNVGIPVAFGVPNTPIASGNVPLILSSGGTFKRPGEEQERAYSFALTPTLFTSTKDGITAGWKSNVEFKP